MFRVFDNLDQLINFPAIFMHFALHISEAVSGTVVLYFTYCIKTLLGRKNLFSSVFLPLV